MTIQNNLPLKTGDACIALGGRSLLALDFEQNRANKRFALRPDIGTYTHPRIGSLTFRAVGDCLMLRISWQVQEIPSLALDNTGFTYEDFGLVRFHLANNGTVPTLKWRTHIFTHTEE